MALISFEDLPSTNTPLNATNLNFNFNEVLNLICPVGKVEVFFDNNDHSNYLGFTWERTLVGRVAVGIDSNDTDFDTIGKTGGSKELQEHTHSGGILIDNQTPGGGRYYFQQIGTTNGTNFSNSLRIGSTGTGDSGNLQPYQVVAYWKRVS